MSKFYKHYAESDLGEGVCYLEISHDWPVRQVEVYGNTYLFGDEDHLDHLADQPFPELDLGQKDEITKEEFESVWSKAMKGCQ